MADAATGRLLRAALMEDAWAVPSPAVAKLATGVDPVAVARIAEFHGVAGYVRAAVTAAGTAPAVVAALDTAYYRGLFTHARALRDLAVVADVLTPLGIPYAVLKGPVLATRTHARPDLRAYTDLDVLVPPPHFGRAVEGLIDAGCVPVVTAWRALQCVEAGEIAMTMPSGGALDLHWHTLNSRALRATFAVDPAAMVARSKPASVGSVSVPALDAADDFVYVAMHNVLSGADRLIWTKDVDLLARTFRARSDDVATRAHEAGAGLVVAVALSLAASTLGTPVPAGLRRALDHGSAWPRIAALVTRGSRPGSSAGHQASLNRVVARSTRGRTPSSLRELSRRARAAAGPSGVRPGQQPPDSDQPQARAEFTDWVDGHAKLAARRVNRR